jgi:adenosine deaminase
MRFSPEHYAFINGFPREKVIERIVRGVRRAEKKHKGIEVNFLLTLNRMKQKPKEMLYLIDMAKDFHKDGMAGIDLAGDEINFPAKDFKSVFKRAKDSGLFGMTIHAGEAVGPESMWDAINHLYADRIGHGVAAIQDEKLIDYLRDKKIALEQCFTSNIQTGAVSSLKKHPFPKLYEKGVYVTICTDDPTVQQASLNDDYYIASKQFKFGLDDFKAVNLHAIESAFMSDEKKAKLKKRYLKAFDEAALEIEEGRNNATA